MEPGTLALAALSGGIVALFLTVFGGGGSVLAVPLLLYVVGVTEPHVAIGVSAAGVSLNALTALAGQARAGRVSWAPALVFAGFGVVGAWAGSSLAKAIDGQALLLAFAVAMGAVGLAMLRPLQNDKGKQRPFSEGLMLRLGGAGLTVGAASGFFGIGGGFLIVPGLMAATGMALVTAQASSLVSVAAFGATTAVNYSLSGLVAGPLVLSMAVGGAIGTVAGLPISRQLGANAVLGRRLFASLILLVAGYVAFKAMFAF